MPDVPLADTCVCGVPHWHKFIAPSEKLAKGGSGSMSAATPFLWCRKCGCLRFMLESHWQVPLDRAGDVAHSVPLSEEPDEPPTSPGTPGAKGRR
jgi:hypothetical protein